MTNPDDAAFRAEWLLLDRPVDQVVLAATVDRARIAAPDPRWFALHKLWMAVQAKRNPVKRNKDRKRRPALLQAFAEATPHYPLDAAFKTAISEELMPMWREWERQRPTASEQAW